MEIYYKKIRKKSISSILIGIGMIAVSCWGITDYTVGSGAADEMSERIIMLVIFGFLMLMGIFMFYASVKSVSSLKKNMEQLGLSEEEFARDLAKGPDFSSCNLGEHYLLKCTGGTDIIVLDGALVVYPEIETTRKNGYTYYSYHVYVTERSGKEKSVEAKSQDEMEQIYDSIMKIVPYAITENDSVVRELRKKNLSELIRIVEKRKTVYHTQSANV